MPADRYSFTGAGARRIVDAVRKVERTPLTQPSARGGQRPEFSPWVPFKNASGEIIPGFAVVRPADTILPSQYAPKVASGYKPNTTFHRSYRLNSGLAVPIGGYGLWTHLTETNGLYNTADGTPAFGESWGAVPSQWYLGKHRPGFTILGDVTTGAGAAVRVQQEIVNSVRGKTDAAIAKGAAGTVSLWCGAAASKVDSTVDIASVYNPYADIASGMFVLLTWVDGQPELAAGEC